MKDKKYFDFQKKSIMALLQNKQNGFVKWFRLRLSIGSRKA